MNKKELSKEIDEQLQLYIFRTNLLINFNSYTDVCSDTKFLLENIPFSSGTKKFMFSIDTTFAEIEIIGVYDIFSIDVKIVRIRKIVYIKKIKISFTEQNDYMCKLEREMIKFFDNLC